MNTETNIKTCQKCGNELPIDDFYRYRKHYQSWCKNCMKAATARWQKEKFANDPDYKAKTYAARTRWQKEKLANDPEYALFFRIKIRAKKDGIRIGSCKEAEALIGCTLESYVKYLGETTPIEKFNWEDVLTHGKEYHIHHILPVASFDKSEPGWEFEAFHYTNTILVGAAEHMKLHSKTITDPVAS